ncbi:hypothetical protein NZA98_01255, partial [Escherichia coli]|nr:hypothetical protein [Escherichia coli]
IEQGEANISGFKRIRDSSMRHRELEEWDEFPIPGESHTYPGTGGGGNSSGGNGGGRGGADPQAQNFALPEPRQLTGINFHVCKIGNPTNHLLVNQVSVDVGMPTTDILAEAFVPMVGTTTGWREARYNYPVFTSNDRTYAFVIKSDDNEHSISIAALGGFDADEQK